MKKITVDQAADLLGRTVKITARRASIYGPEADHFNLESWTGHVIALGRIVSGYRSPLALVLDTRGHGEGVPIISLTRIVRVEDVDTRCVLYDGG